MMLRYTTLNIWIAATVKAPSPQFYRLALLCCLIFWPHAALGQDERIPQLYTVEQLRVEAEVGERSAPETRDSALSDGERQAMRQVISRLVAPESRDRALGLIKQLTPAEVRQFIENYEIVREVVTGRAYRGEITYHFNADAVQGFFKSHALKFVERIAPPMVFVAVMRSLNSVWVWEDTNIWLTHLTAHPPSSPMVPFLFADSRQDRAALTRPDLLALELNSLKALITRYSLPPETGRVAIVVLDFKDADANAFSPLKLRVVEIDFLGQRRRYEADIPEAEDLEVRLIAARNLAIRAIEDEWKRNLPPLIEEQSRAQLTIKLNALDDWLAIRRRLADVGQFSNVRLHSLSTQDVVLSVTYNGSLDGLIAAVARNDYVSKSLETDTDTTESKPLNESATSRPVASDVGDAQDMPKYLLTPTL